MKKHLFGTRLAFYRKRAGMKQEELARMLNVTPQAVSKWENGSFPDGTLLPKISEILDVSLDILFGLQEEQSEPDYLTELMKKLSGLDEKERSEKIIEICYHLICAYDGTLPAEQIQFPDTLKKETFAQLRADSAISLARLNPDMQFFTFVKLPENGIGSYARGSERMMKLFRLLSDRDMMNLIAFAEGLPRNYILTKESLAQHLHLSTERVSQIVAECIQLGIIWELRAEIGGKILNTYGYVHSVPLTTILVLASALTNYISNCEPDIDIWTKGAFRAEDDKA